MSKDKSEKDGSIRKRQKVNSSDEVEDLSPKVDKMEISQIFPKLCDFYDELARSSEGESDLLEYRAACSYIAQLMTEITQLKTEKPENWEKLVAEKRSEVPLAVIYLKKLNRCEKLRIRCSREKTNDKKQELESLYLQLQNTQCEIKCLSDEVDKCLELRNVNFGFEMVPVEEFYRDAPTTLSNVEVTKTDEHKLQLARLEWELSQRKDKAALCDQLEASRRKVVADIKKKEVLLDSLKPLVVDVLNAAKPLSEKLGVVSKSEPQKKYSLASLLPDKLYFLFVHVDAYREACDKKLVITVDGNVEAAKKFKMEPLRFLEPGKEGSPEKKTLEEKQKKLLTRHPLFVRMKIILKDRNSICLNFYYLVYLDVLSVFPRISLTSPVVNSSAACPLLRDRTILNELFPGDNGVHSPNPTNYYLLKKVGLEKVEIEVSGLCYGWVQRLAGLDVGRPAVGAHGCQDVQLAQTTIPLVMKAIRNRLTSRLTLASQIISFESGNVTVPVSMAGVKLTSVLKTWLPSTFSDFSRRPFTKFLLQAGAVSPHDFFYMSIIKKPPAILEVVVVLKPDYPSSPPLFVFQLLLNKQKLNSRNNTHIRDMEREVNVYWEELVAKNRSPLYLLSGLMHRALVLSEILLHTVDPQQFPDLGKAVLTPVRGRTRSLPFKFVSVGDGLFVQR